MYLITENEAPAPNASLSGPPHLLSKSLTKAMTSVVDSMHDQMTSFINFSIGWWSCSFVSLSSPDPGDLAFLMNHLQPIAGHWRAFGLQLGLSSGDLHTIAATPLLIPGGPAAYLQEVLSKRLDHAPPFPTLSKLCGALRSHAVNQSRLALDLQQQYQTRRTGLSA